MLRYIIFFIWSILIIYSSFGQDTTGAKRIYAGKVNQSEVIMYFTLVEGDPGFYVVGNYYYKKFGIDIPVTGTLSSDGKIRLEEFVYDEKGSNEKLSGIFSGIKKGNEIKGKWMKPDSSGSYPFSLKEIIIQTNNSDFQYFLKHFKYVELPYKVDSTEKYSFPIDDVKEFAPFVFQDDEYLVENFGQEGEKEFYSFVDFFRLSKNLYGIIYLEKFSYYPSRNYHLCVFNTEGKKISSMLIGGYLHRGSYMQHETDENGEIIEDQWNRIPYFEDIPATNDYSGCSR